MPTLVQLESLEKRADARHLGSDSPRAMSPESWTTIAIFVGIMLAFGLLTLLVEPPAKMPLDNRFRTALPKPPNAWHQLHDFTRTLESYYNDRFAFRTEIISVRNLLTLNALGDTGSPKVVRNRDGWLEYLADGNLTSFLNQQRFTMWELRAIGRELEARRAWLEKRGIRYIFVVAPDKSTIYPGDMPFFYHRMPGYSRQDQLIMYLQSHTHVQTIDLRPALKAAASKQPVYFKTDTHWNAVGAWVASNVISATLKQWFPQVPPPRSTTFRGEAYSGGLSRMLGLQSWLRESSPAVDVATSPPLWQVTNNLPISKEHWPGATPQISVTEIKNAQLPSAVLLHDSFMSLDFQPFLPDNFRRCVEVWTYDFPAKIISEEKPDVVIQEVVERSLVFSPFRGFDQKSNSPR